MATEVLGVEAFGPHLVLDGSGCKLARLICPSLALEFLEAMPRLIHMTPIMPPFITRNREGVSGIVLIAESHISIHTMPEILGFHLDIFSCKAFNQKKAISFTKKFFGATGSRRRLFNRGLEYPRHVNLREVLIRERTGFNQQGKGGPG